MFKKILVANRGEIAVRIVRACRDMGIETVALYSRNDRESLHVRLADECKPVFSERRYADMDEVLAIAKETGADAIHPGYGFLAEQPAFARACVENGIAFIGPPPEVIEQLQNKIKSMETVSRAGYMVPPHSETTIGENDSAMLHATAEEMGFPLVLKGSRGGRGRGSRVVFSREELDDVALIARREAFMIYGSTDLYLEKVIVPSHYVAVQLLGDKDGNLIHLGEREGSLLLHNQKLVEESPAPCLTQGQRERLWDAALEIARLFHYQNAGTVEFLVDSEGRFYFTEIKSRIQIEHPVSEMVSGVDIMREQIRIAAGESLPCEQDEVTLRGVSMQVRINAEDPWNNYLPSPGRLETFRLPGGPSVRVDTYGYTGCRVHVRFDPLLANVVAWGEDREECITRLRRAIQDFKIVGVQTNLPLHLWILSESAFVSGRYDTTFMSREAFDRSVHDPAMHRDLAVVAAVAFLLRNQVREVTTPERTKSGWHRSSRRLPV